VNTTALRSLRFTGLPFPGYVWVVPSYDFGLLGRFAVRVDGQPVPDGAWRHKRAAELVKILALADPHRLHCEHVTDVLWPDLAPGAAAGNLRKAVHFARAALGTASAIGRDGAMLELCPGEPITVRSPSKRPPAQASPERWMPTGETCSPRIVMRRGQRSRENGCARYICGC